MLKNCRNCKKRQKFGGNERSEKQEPNQSLEDSGGQSSWPQTISEPPYSLDLVPADFSLFWRIKSDLADVSITHETFKTELERVLQSIGENEFTGAFQKWLHCHEKCIALQGGSVEKS